ncbi:hypothetical protein [Domibacillus sp. A3M-37]
MKLDIEFINLLKKEIDLRKLSNKKPPLTF